MSNLKQISKKDFSQTEKEASPLLTHGPKMFMFNLVKLDKWTDTGVLKSWVVHILFCQFVRDQNGTYVQVEAFEMVAI